MSLPQDAVGAGAGDLLDGNVALKALVQSAIDRAHATRADPLEHPEPIDDQLAQHQLHIQPGLRWTGAGSCARKASCAHGDPPEQG